MSLKTVPFLPEGSARVLRLQVIPVRWTTSSASPSTGFVQAWFETDTDSDEGRSTNWGAISGLALSLVIGASFWIGAAMLIGRLLK